MFTIIYLGAGSFRREATRIFFLQNAINQVDSKGKVFGKPIFMLPSDIMMFHDVSMCKGPAQFMPRHVHPTYIPLTPSAAPGHAESWLAAAVG